MFSRTRQDRDKGTAMAQKTQKSQLRLITVFSLVAVYAADCAL